MKTDRYILLGILGIGLIFLGMFIIVTGISLTIYDGYFELGIAFIVLSLVLFLLGLLAILFSTGKIKMPESLAE